MSNHSLSKIFSDIALYLEMDKVPFKPQAYEKAALALEALGEDAADIYQKSGLSGLEAIEGVGESIAEKIEEYVKTGKIKYYQELKKKMPVDVQALTSVEGLGPRMVRELYEKLKIKNLADLEKAAVSGKIGKLPRFGVKSEQNILRAIEFLKRDRGRFNLGMIYPFVEETQKKLAERKEVKCVSPAGSLRRMKETIGDIDFLVCLKENKSPLKAKAMAASTMDFFVSLPGVVKIWDKGLTKSSVHMESGFDMDIRVIPAKSYGAALQYFTGSKEHNIALRKIAISKGLKLNEYGLFRGKKTIACETEREIYRALGMSLMPPEIRENQGEIELAQKNKIPRLIEYDDVKGDLHCHSNWDGGSNSIEEMAQAAREMGYQYIGIADHTKFLRIENGLDERQLARQRKETDKLNALFAGKKTGFRILQGCEANIMPDGSVDITDEALGKLDYVIAGVHSRMKMPKSQMTERIIRAMKNPHVDIISHPTGRSLGKRDEYAHDLGKILRAAREYNVALEINGSPWRLDLKDSNIRLAKKAGVKMIINTDSHQKEHLKFMKYGVSQARRGWAEKEDIINSRTVNDLLRFFKNS
ncbi:MAG: DNA polymerase/3'-5' exonuclease PolX [Candidatus Pacebacteria bacterium]|nr:DNA polymerase/3'-5' exonuclease PolX [Candidatus Paceibacterota bacterium]